MIKQHFKTLTYVSKCLIRTSPYDMLKTFRPQDWQNSQFYHKSQWFQARNLGFPAAHSYSVCAALGSKVGGKSIL